MRVCYIANEFYAYGIYGGYGALLRSFCRGLNARGVETFALIRRYGEDAIRNQPEVENIEGTTVIALPNGYAARCLRKDLFALPDADLYVSMEPRFDTLLAKRANPASKHAIYFADPVSWSDFWSINSQGRANQSLWIKWKTWAEFNALEIFRRKAAHCVDAHFAHGNEIAARAMRIYQIDALPKSLPNPMEMPEEPIVKAKDPTVLFMGRWDLQKRPELFARLAENFPDVRFIMAGEATDDPVRDKKLRNDFSRIPNLILPGFISGAEKDRFLRESWILANTSVREGLPVSYLDALSYECALLSSVESNELVSRFGRLTKDDNFSAALTLLLQDDRWRKLGQQGSLHIKDTYAFDKAIDTTLDAYRALIET